MILLVTALTKETYFNTYPLYLQDMLKDLNRFISSTRLVIRNLPPNLDEPKLKKLIYKFATVKLKMTELKIMKDLKTGKSKGFAFATFAEDEMAISTLR